MRFFKSFNERKSIVDLYEYYNWVQLVESLSSGSFAEDIMPYFKENFDLVNQTVQPKALYFNKRYLNVLATYRMSIVQKMQKYEDCQEIIEQYLSDYKNSQESTP